MSFPGPYIAFYSPGFYSCLCFPPVQHSHLPDPLTISIFATSGRSTTTTIAVASLRKRILSLSGNWE